MKGAIDGDQLCLMTDHFINLQESPAVFEPLSSDLAQRFQAQGMRGLTFDEVTGVYQRLLEQIPEDKHCCPNWNERDGMCGACDWCEIAWWLG